VKQLFNDLTFVSAIIIITSVLLQQRGSSLGASFGGDTNYYRSKRGAEKIIYYSTIVSAVVFVMSVVLSILAKH
jgi:protein translocase SecG subunit